MRNVLCEHVQDNSEMSHDMIMNLGLTYSKGIMGVKDRRFKFSKWRNWGRNRAEKELEPQAAQTWWVSSKVDRKTFTVKSWHSNEPNSSGNQEILIF